MSGTLSPYIPPYPYSDGYLPIIPSAATILRPIGATLIIPGPALPLPINYDLNRDPRVHKQVVKYYRQYTLDKWLYGDMIDLLGYFTVDNNGVHLIRNLSEYREDAAAKDTPEDIDKKVDYIKKYFLTEDTMYRILKKLIRGTGINWYDLHKNEFFVKEDIKMQIKKILRGTIEERSKNNSNK